MSSLLLLPSTSLLPSLPYSVHGAAAALPSSPSSSWSPNTSPKSRMQSLCLATSATSPVSASAYTLPPAISVTQPQQPPNAVVAHVLASPPPRVLPASTASPTAATVGQAYSHHSPLAASPPTASYLSASSTMSPAGLMNMAGSQSSPQPVNNSGGMAGQSLLPSNLQGGQSIVFDQHGQAFVLSPLNNVSTSFQPVKQHSIQMQQYGSVQYQQAVQPFSGNQDWMQQSSMRQGGQHLGSAVSSQSNTIVLSAQPPPQYQQSWSGGEPMQLSASPLGMNQHIYTTQPVTTTLNVPMGSGVLHSHVQPLVSGLSSAPFGSPTAALTASLSPVPVVSSAFQPLVKRAMSANVSPSMVPSLRPLSPAVATLAAQRGKPMSPNTVSSNDNRTPPRKMSAASSHSSASSTRHSDDAEALDTGALIFPVTSITRNSSDSSGEQSTSPRIDGLSSSRLLTHINKKPSHVLPFIIHRSQLPHNFDHLVNSASSSATAQPATPTHHSSAAATASDMVTVNIRVMGGPSLNELYFVAADISQLIHSRKSNIAKAVSVFTDDERARCSVVCPRSNNTQSTHILTVLTMAGVKRLLHSSRSTIALPLLAWLQDKVDHIVAQDSGSRSQHQSQQQRPVPLAVNSKRKSSSAGVEQQQQLAGRAADVKEEDGGSSEKRTKRE